MNKQTTTILICAGAFLVLGGVLFVNSPNEELNEKLSEVSTVNNAPNMETQTQGLNIEILTAGDGVGVASGQTAVVHYTGMLTDGKVFDSSIPKGQTFPVQLGRGQVIKGWEIGLVGMKVGEKRKLTIAPELGYGKDGYPGVIPPNATLIFEVTLVSIQ